MHVSQPLALHLRLPFPLLRLPYVRLDQGAVVAVRDDVAAYDGYHEAGEGKHEPGPGTVSTGDVDVHAEEACDESREHQGKRDQRQALHDDVHVVADDGGEGVHRARQDVGVDVRHRDGLLVVRDDIVQEVRLVLVVQLEDGTLDHLLKEHLVARQARREVDKRLLDFQKLDQLIVHDALVQLLLDQVLLAVDVLEDADEDQCAAAKDGDDEALPGVHRILAEAGAREVLQDDAVALAYGYDLDQQKFVKTYYFNEDEVYSLDKESRLFPYQGRVKFNMFIVRGSGFNMNVWNKAASQFEVGMTLEQCIRIFLQTELTRNTQQEPSALDKLVQHISPPVFEREPENQNNSTFDRIRITVGLSRYLFSSWEDLKREVETYRSEIYQRVVQKLENDRQFKRYGVPINFIKLSDVTLLLDYSLEFIYILSTFIDIFLRFVIIS